MKPGQRAYSLGSRLSWLFAALTFAGLGLLSVAIHAAAAWNLSLRADVELDRKTQLVRHLVAEASAGGDVAAMRHKLSELLIGHTDLQVTLLDTAGGVAYQSVGKVPQDLPQRSAMVELAASVRPVGFARARITLDRSRDASLLGGLAALLALATAAGAAAISVSGFWLVRRALAPLHSLAEQTRTLRVGQLGQRLELRPAVQELDPWIEQFNGLLARLDQAYRQLEAFNADVAHELRTPLATLINQTEVLLSRPRTPGELQETLGSSLEELRRLSGVVNDMLFLARADEGVQVRTLEPSSLARQIGQVVEFYDAVLAERQLRGRIAGDAHAPIEPGLFRRALSNLLANAVQYAHPGTEVRIDIRQTPGSVWVEVTNHGPALPPQALPRLFDRFFRLEPAREGSSVHHGLGLAIVAAIARMHGGRTVARSSGEVTTIGFSVASAAMPQRRVPTSGLRPICG